MRILVVGGGGREHALAWKLVQSPRCSELHAAPGNPGIAALGQCHPVRPDDAEGLVALCQALSIDLVVVGPEAPLVAGIADALRRVGVAVFGPSAAAAQIEGSKSFAKEILQAAGVPTAAALPVARSPCVVKADGLAAGKGVFVCRTRAELDEGLRAISRLGGPFVVEELLEGDELSVLAIADGADAVGLPAARDYSPVGEGDTGANTGGMGSFSPVGGYGAAEVNELVEAIHRPVLAELAARGTPFIGCLYAGLILTADGPRVLEFNCRFGDPETQAVLPILDGDVLELLGSAAAGSVRGIGLRPPKRAAVTVALTAADYPARGDTGTPIVGVEAAEAAGALVFHAGTARRDGTLITNGGRILNVTASGETVAEAREHAYHAVELISFAGMRYRRDIAAEVHA